MALNRKARNEFADRSTGSDGGDYYRNLGMALNAFDGALQGHDLCLDRNEILDVVGDDGRAHLSIRDEWGGIAGYALLTWHRMESGRFEVIGYIS